MNEPHNEELRKLWQRQPAEAGAATSDDIRRRVDALTMKIRRRDRIIYLCGAVIVPSWAAGMWLLPDLRITAGVVLATAVWLVYQLHKQSAAQMIASDVADHPCLDFHRTRLVRERNLYRKMDLWYLLPVGVSQIAILFSLLTNARFPRTAPFLLFVLTFVGSSVTVLAVARKRWQREATALQGEIESLDAVKRST